MTVVLAVPYSSMHCIKCVCWVLCTRPFVLPKDRTHENLAAYASSASRKGIKVKGRHLERSEPGCLEIGFSFWYRLRRRGATEDSGWDSPREGADRFFEEGGVANFWNGTKSRGGRGGDIAVECRMLSVLTWERMAARVNLCVRVMGFLSLIGVLETRPWLREKSFVRAAGRAIKALPGEEVCTFFSSLIRNFRSWYGPGTFAVTWRINWSTVTES